MEEFEILVRAHPILRRLFLTADDRVVVGQPPNAPMLAAAGFYAASRVAPDNLRPWLDGVSRAAVALWAVEEIGWGVNLFRRISGVAALVGLAAASCESLRSNP